MAKFSPTGYWAIYLLGDELMAAIERARPGLDVSRVETFPIVTWNTDGEALILDRRGKLTPVSQMYADTAEFFIDTRHPDGVE